MAADSKDFDTQLLKVALVAYTLEVLMTSSNRTTFWSLLDLLAMDLRCAWAVFSMESYLPAGQSSVLVATRMKIGSGHDLVMSSRYVPMEGW